MVIASFDVRPKFAQPLAVIGSTENSEKLNQGGFKFSRPRVIAPVYLQFNGLSRLALVLISDFFLFFDTFPGEAGEVPIKTPFSIPTDDGKKLNHFCSICQNSRGYSLK